MNKTKINLLKVEYCKLFPEDWMSKFDFSSEELCSQNISTIVSSIESFKIDAYCLFAKSILSGEYVIRDVKKSLDDLSDALFHEDFTDGYTEIQQNVWNRLGNAESLIINAISDYKYFISEFENKCNVKHPKQLFHLVKKNNQFDNDDPYYPLLFELLFKVCTLDLNPSYNENVIRKLLICYTEVSSIISEKRFNERILQICSVLKEKCIFLLRKILTADKTDINYLVDYHQRHIDSNTSVAPYLRTYIERFEFYIKELYSNEAMADELDKKVYYCSNNIWELPLLIKYYKDKKGTTQKQVDNIITRFKKQLSEYTKEGLYDKYALATMENYMANCRLSFRLSQNNYALEDLMNDISDIEDMQRRTGIHNFYPFRKACLFLISYIRKHRNDIDLAIEELLLNLESLLDKFESALIWCRGQDYIPIQVPFKGCLVKTVIGPVFVPSTYCRPLQYEKHFDELVKLKMEFLTLKSEAIIHEDKREIDKLKSQIDTSNKRLIELFTLFITIAAFIFGTIEFFASNQNKEVSNMLLSTLSFGIVLLLFSSSISIITQGKEFSWKCLRTKISIIMAVLYFILFIVLICLTYRS